MVALRWGGLQCGVERQNRLWNRLGVGAAALQGGALADRTISKVQNSLQQWCQGAEESMVSSDKEDAVQGQANEGPVRIYLAA